MIASLCLLSSLLATGPDEVVPFALIIHAAPDVISAQPVPERSYLKAVIAQNAPGQKLQKRLNDMGLRNLRPGEAPSSFEVYFHLQCGGIIHWLQTARDSLGSLSVIDSVTYLPRKMQDSILPVGGRLPSPIQMVAPEWPEGDLRGRVLVEVSIDSCGVVVGQQVLESDLPDAYQEAALAAAGGWVFSPAGSPGKTTAAQIVIPFRCDEAREGRP